MINFSVVLQVSADEREVFLGRCGVHQVAVDGNVAAADQQLILPVDSPLGVLLHVCARVHAARFRLAAVFASRPRIFGAIVSRHLDSLPADAGNRPLPVAFTSTRSRTLKKKLKISTFRIAFFYQFKFNSVK